MKKKKKYSLKRQFNWVDTLWILGIVIVLISIWKNPFLYPFKMFVVLMHEISHGLAAILTGGSIKQISLMIHQGGSALTSGGNELVIASAGYVGSFIWGLVLLAFSKTEKISKYALGAVGLLILIIALLYIRTPFALVYSIIFAVVLLVGAKFLPSVIVKYFLKILGVLVCLYAVLDIKSDLFFSKHINDAVILEGMTGIPAIFFTITWIFIVGILIWKFVLVKWKKEEKEDENWY